MEKEQLRAWYVPCEQPAAEPMQAPAEEEWDIFEEAGLCPVEETAVSPWTPEAQKPKKRRWGAWIGGMLGVAAVVAIIVTTSLFFTQQRPDRADVYDAHKDSPAFDFSETFPGKEKETSIERAPVNGEVQLSLLSHEELEPMAWNTLYERCIPSVVGIKSAQNLGYAWGTGIVMTEDGYILTNAHLLEGADAACVVLQDDTEYEAKLVGSDTISDIAVLKVEAQGLTPAQFGDSALLNVGDEVAAIGNPLNERFSGTMTPGIISGVSRELTYRGRTMTLLQTSAAINEGNSGGPLFNRYGQVVGITNMKIFSSGSFTPVEGIGFAIPSVTVQSIANALLRDGAVIGRPGLGIYAAEVAENTAHPAGVQVATVTEGSDAAAQGLREGDIVIRIDGIAVDSFDTLKNRIDALSVGDTVRLEIWREGRILEKNVTLIDQNRMTEE